MPIFTQIIKAILLAACLHNIIVCPPAINRPPRRRLNLTGINGPRPTPQSVEPEPSDIYENFFSITQQAEDLVITESLQAASRPIPSYPFAKFALVEQDIVCDSSTCKEQHCNICFEHKASTRSRFNCNCSCNVICDTCFLHLPTNSPQYIVGPQADRRCPGCSNNKLTIPAIGTLFQAYRKPIIKKNKSIYNQSTNNLPIYSAYYIAATCAVCFNFSESCAFHHNCLCSPAPTCRTCFIKLAHEIDHHCYQCFSYNAVSPIGYWTLQWNHFFNTISTK